MKELVKIASDKGIAVKRIDWFKILIVKII